MRRANAHSCIRNANVLWLHPFILLGRAILSTLPLATEEDAYCHDKRYHRNLASGLKTLAKQSSLGAAA